MDIYANSSQSAKEALYQAAASLDEAASRTNLYACTFLTVSLIIFARGWFFAKGNKLVRTPIVGAKLSIIARYYFFKHASDYVQGGYDKVNDPGTPFKELSSLSKFKTTLFKLSGHDILVIPNKYVNELRNLPDHRLSSIQANIDVRLILCRDVTMDANFSGKEL